MAAYLHGENQGKAPVTGGATRATATLDLGPPPLGEEGVDLLDPGSPGRGHRDVGCGAWARGAETIGSGWRKVMP